MIAALLERAVAVVDRAGERRGVQIPALAPTGGARVAVPGEATVDTLMAIAALDRAGARVYVLPAGHGDPAGLAARHEATLWPEIGPGRGERGVVLFTSGTTGEPKPASYAWESLLARVHTSEALRGSVWLSTYPPSAFAGMQVVLHALANAGTLVLGSGGPAEMAVQAAAAGATHFSGTPTFWRFLLATADPAALAALSPVQITLGGEAVDQGVLDALRARFPGARITHIYASTEAGVCFSVHDGRAGFPAAWLDADRDVRLRLDDGELLVCSPHGIDDGWIRTGDLVGIDGDRARFQGRLTERINVGGRKVDPRVVEEVVLEVDGVVAVRVSGRKSSVMGELVRAEIVPAPGADRAAVRAAVLARCQARLQPFQTPRFVEWVDALATTASGKVART